MGSATTTTSTAQKSFQKRAKRAMNEAVESKNLHRAADIGVTALLATQPNGPAKVPVYSYTKHSAAFIDAANEAGVEAGVAAAGEEVLQSEIGGAYAEMTVTAAQAAVTTAAESETASRGVDAANKNLQMPSEQAAEDTLTAIMTNGADALLERRKSKKNRE
jgi:hypothetical protein